MRSGMIAIIGRPNAGKSTLLNSILKEKVSIISDKPQTTRNNIQGIYTTDRCQFVFIDTPGIHKPHHELGRNLNKSAYQSLLDVDVIYLIVDISQPFGSGDAFLLDRLKQNQAPCFLLLNKIDLLKKEDVLKQLIEWSNRFEFEQIIPISAKQDNNIDELLKTTEGYLSEGVMFYPKDMISDHGRTFQTQEIIREKILYKTEEEIPHSIAVVVESLNESENEVVIDALVIVERDSQKAILIGKQASMIKTIRLLAQKELKSLYGKKCHLNLYVRIEKNWRNRQNKLQQFGYALEDFK